MTEPRPRRRATESGYTRGDETRRKIIDAAIRLFGQHGFAGASTRDIAAEAGVNAPALQYYFENKEGVYRACAEALVDDALLVLDPAIQRAQGTVRNGAPTRELIDVFVDLQCALADHMFMNSNEAHRRLFFAREQGGGEPKVGTRVLHERLRAPLYKVSVALLARITGRSETDPGTIVRMCSLFGQFLAFHISRDSMLSMLGWTDIDDENGEFVKANVSAQTRLLLDFWQREGKIASQ